VAAVVALIALRTAARPADATACCGNPSWGCSTPCCRPRTWPRCTPSSISTARGEPVEFHTLRTRESGRQRFVYIDVLVPGDWTVTRGHDLAERVAVDIARDLPGTTTFTHLQPRESTIPADRALRDRDTEV